MPSESAAPNESDATETQSIDRVRALLTEALEIADGLNLSPEIGARLQEAISALEESAKT